MWLNPAQITEPALKAYRKALRRSCPNHVVIDHLFDNAKLDEVIDVLQQQHHWQTQQHTYSSLYVDKVKWQNTAKKQRFVQRDLWQRNTVNSTANIAAEFLSFLRGDEFMSVLSRIFNIRLTDINVMQPEINTNYFRLGAADFVNQHADDSPGREVCMLLYLNKHWHHENGGELVFMGQDNQPVTISPLYNRCVLFNPSSAGAEHWVNPLTTDNTPQYRYNITSWYWSE